MKYIGIVYRLFYGDLSYVGSTTNLKQRMYNHISKYKNNIGYCSSKEIICFDDYEIEVLAEIYYVENHLDINLLNLEREYMEQYKCVNKYRPIVSKEEKKEEDKEKNKQHYLKKRDERLEKQKQYRAEIKEYRLKNNLN